MDVIAQVKQILDDILLHSITGLDMMEEVPRYYAKPKVLFIKVDARHNADGSLTELNRLMARIRATRYYFY